MADVNIGGGNGANSNSNRKENLMAQFSEFFLNELSIRMADHASDLKPLNEARVLDILDMYYNHRVTARDQRERGKLQKEFMKGKDDAFQEWLKNRNVGQPSKFSR